MKKGRNAWIVAAVLCVAVVAVLIIGKGMKPDKKEANVENAGPPREKEVDAVEVMRPTELMTEDGLFLLEVPEGAIFELAADEAVGGVREPQREVLHGGGWKDAERLDRDWAPMRHARATVLVGEEGLVDRRAARIAGTIDDPDEVLEGHVLSVEGVDGRRANGRDEVAE